MLCLEAALRSLVPLSLAKEWKQDIVERLQAENHWVIWFRVSFEDPEDLIRAFPDHCKYPSALLPNTRKGMYGSHVAQRQSTGITETVLPFTFR